MGRLDPKPLERYLDLGCCGGIHTVGLQNLPCKYYGVGGSPEVVERIKQALSKQENLISVIVGDADDLPYEDRFFDLATCIGLLSHHPPAYRPRVLSQLRRVLKHNGRAGVDYPNPLHPRIRDAAKMEELRGSPIYLEDPDQVERELCQAGFDIEEHFPHSAVVVYIISPHVEIPSWPD